MSAETTTSAEELLRQQSALAKFGELAVKSDDLTEILNEACRLVSEALGTELAKVMQLQDDGRSLLVRSGVGWKNGVVGVVTVRADDNTSEGHALKSGEAMISSDIASEKRFNYPQFLIDNGVRAVVNVIIIGADGGPPYGILQVDSREPREFTSNDTAFLKTYANILAAAVTRLQMIEDLRANEKRLRASISRQEAALETGVIGFYEFDISGRRVIGDKHLARFFDWNPAHLLAGAPIEHVLDRIEPEDRKRFYQAFRAAFRASASYAQEIRVPYASGIRWFSVRGHCDGLGNGAPRHCRGTVIDITAAKSAQDALRQVNVGLEANVRERTAELVEANAKLRAEAQEREEIEEKLRQSHKMEAVGQLTGGLAHDFNNLLAGVSGSLELIRTRAGQGRVAEVERFVTVAMTAVNRAAALTHRLLAFSRRQTLAPKSTDVNALVGGLEELFRRTVGPSVEVRLDLSRDLWPTMCDPNQLESVLLNLVINARDAMPEGGKLLIETGNMLSDGGGDVTELETNGGNKEFLNITITDTGTGMPPDVLARVFDPFYTTKPLGQGTGLGLSMVYGYVQQSGGHVRLHSEPGSGTKVFIYLPRNLENAESATEQQALPVRPDEDADGVILVVDDEPAVRMVVREVLTDQGFRVLEAENGVTGLHILESAARIDLLVTDVGLPHGLNGRQLADAARELRPSLGVLFITGYAEGAALGKGGPGEQMQVLTKPFNVEKLISTVRGMFSQ